MRKFTFGSGVTKTELPKYDGSIRVVNPEGAEYEVELTRKGFYSDLPCVIFRNDYREFVYDLAILLCDSGDLGFDGGEPSQWISAENLNQVFDWAEGVVEPQVLKACYDAADEWEAGP